MAFAVDGVAVVVAPTIGPWLGGWITDNFSWRWIFYINVPVGILSLLLTSFLVSDPPYMKKANVKAGFRIDYIGIGLISLGLGSMQIILDKGQREDWLSSNFIRVFFVMMLFGLIAGILWELREKEPVVDLKMLKDRNFAIATLAMFFLGFVLYASTVLIPQLLQQLLGYTATGGHGAVSGRSGDHVHDAHRRDSGLQSGYEDPDYFWLPGFLFGVVRDGGLGPRAGFPARGPGAHAAGVWAGVSVHSD